MSPLHAELLGLVAALLVLAAWVAAGERRYRRMLRQAGRGWLVRRYDERTRDLVVAWRPSRHAARRLCRRWQHANPDPQVRVSYGACRIPGGTR